MIGGAERLLPASVIVLNFNGADHLADCLASLVAQEYAGDLEVIVADNGSTDGSSQVARRFPVLWCPLGRNHGFARGNNLASEHARGEILVFVNNDMRFAPDFVSKLVNPILDDTTIFAADALQLNWTGTTAIHHATRLTRRGLVEGLRRPGLLPMLAIEQIPVRAPVRVLQACAANMAVRRTMFEALGGFDERLPAGWEDTEICWRAWLRGWATVFVPQAICWHKVGATSVAGPGKRVRFRGALGGRLLFATKHLPLPDALAVWLTAVAALARDLLACRRGAARERLSALAEVVRYLPALVGERRTLYALAGTSPRAHLTRLIALGERLAMQQPPQRELRSWSDPQAGR